MFLFPKCRGYFYDCISAIVWRFKNMLRLKMLGLRKAADCGTPEASPEHTSFPESRLALRLPVVPRTVLQTNVTVCGTGTQGLGDRCKSAAGERMTNAFEEWCEYKQKLPQAPRSSSRSPRERYYAARQQHAEAIHRFEEKRKETFAELRRSKREVQALLQQEAVSTHASQCEAIKHEREERRLRLEEYALLKAQWAKYEKALADEIAKIWTDAGHEAEEEWRRWLEQRKQQFVEEKNEFLRLQQQRQASLHEAVTAERNKRNALNERLTTRRIEEQKAKQKCVADLRREWRENVERAKAAQQDALRENAEKTRHELEAWAALKSTCDKNRQVKSESVHVEFRRSTSVLCNNAYEEALLRRQMNADLVRQWKRNAKTSCE